MIKTAHNSKPEKNSYNLRIFLLLSVLTAFILLIIVRLFHLQVTSHGYYQAIAANQHAGVGTVQPKRGEIYLSSFAQGTPLLVATNVTRYTVAAVPKNISDPAKTANQMAPYLQISAADLAKALASTNNYVVIKKQVPEDVGEKIKGLKLSGITLEATTERFYPEKNLASQVLGFLGFKDDKRVGQYGVEGKFEEQLAGTPGIEGAKKDASGKLLPDRTGDFIPAIDGDDIYLTIDPAIQVKVQEILQKSVSEHSADAGSVVIMDPKTGAIMAMASFPDFDPNVYNKVSDIGVFSNKILSADYEPGSIFKAFTMAAAINEGKITPETTFVNTGSVQVDDKLIKNSDPKPLGVQTMVQVLSESLNTGVFFAEQQIGNETFKKYVERFGFGKPVNFELSGQSPGNLNNLKQKGDVFFATASFGQGITTTPIQLVQAYNALANGGRMVAPHIISKVVHPDGSEAVTEPDKGTQILEPKTASTLSAMLVDVVENGHGKRAGVKGYYIAGKTGTAQVSFTNKAGYDPNRNIGSFAGYGPVDNPRFVMLVRIDNPRDVKFAEATAAPTFGEIASFLLNYLQVPPTR